MEWHRKDLLTLYDLTAEEITYILETAQPCKQVFKRQVKKFPTLRGRVVANVFYEPSTRTRTSFELAGKFLSADVINFSAAGSSVQKGESLADTAKTLQALGADIVVLRHQSAGAPEFLARCLSIPVINAGDGMHAHPTQALLDLFTILERKGRIEGLRVGILGDILHSRVARSNIHGLTKLGATVTVIGPPSLMPAGIEELGVEVSYDLDAVIGHLDVINVLRIQIERGSRSAIPSIQEYVKLYGLRRRHLEKASPELLILHPGPANLGVEITSEIAECPQSAIREQVANGVAVRMALLYILSGGDARGLVA